MQSTSNYLWIFIFNDRKIKPFPLFFTGRKNSNYLVSMLSDRYRERIEYLFSDNPDNLTPDDGYVVSFKNLDMLERI